jgi:molecular chaperone HscB
MQMQEKLQNWSNSFANAFRGHKFEEAKNCIRRMTYYDRVNEEIVKRL